MNRQEYLLTCLSEELGEVAQCVGKIQRFGLMDKYKAGAETNDISLVKEMNDVIAVMELVVDELQLIGYDDSAAIMAKKKKLIKYMQYSRDRGTLQDEIPSTNSDTPSK
jgi:NTP pyrophosphatase (non-canonical NTP hydrolase)